MSFFVPPAPDDHAEAGKAVFIDNPNSDNGALVAAVSLLAAAYSVGEDEYLHCLQTLHSYRMYPEAQCMEKLHAHLYRTLGPGGHKSTPGRVRVWWHREGFWRTALHMRDAPSGPQQDQDVFENLYSLCYTSSDLVGNGNKRMASDMLEAYQSTGCDVTRVRDSKEGRNPRCHWLSPEGELSLLRKHCQWHSPACGGGSHETAKNICLFIPVVRGASKNLLSVLSDSVIT